MDWRRSYHESQKLYLEQWRKLRDPKSTHYAPGATERLPGSTWSFRVVEAREEAKKIVDEGKTLGEKARKEMISKATEESSQIVKRTQEQLAMEKERTMSELREQIADLSIAAASKVIERSLDKEDHMKLLEDYVSKLGELNGQ